MSQRNVLFKFLAVFVVGILVGVGSSQLYFSVDFSGGSSLPSPLPFLGPLGSSGLTLDELYPNAIADVMFVGQDVGSSGLSFVVAGNADLVWRGESGNQSVLVVTFTKYASSYPVGEIVNTTWGEVWVTLVPEVQVFFNNNVGDDVNLTLRAAQLLGLPPNTGNAYFVELWVSPAYLFRPAADNEITDTVAQIALPASMAPDYKVWFDDAVLYSYFPPRYPWTRLGYTYDWGSLDSHVGVSEFVICSNALVVVESVTATAEYLNP